MGVTWGKVMAYINHLWPEAYQVVSHFQEPFE